ncbi:MAG: metal-dependent hydrolase [Methanosarcinaceae archaeon]|nr:metal-dependent hydrolase [Methanosarcinaceae archaeon]
MPYPIAHFMFFMYCFCGIAVYTTVRSNLYHKLNLKDNLNIMLLIIVGGFCSLVPDIPAVYNYFVNGNLHHTMFWFIPTHSLMFSYFAFTLAVIIGYVVYRDLDKAAFLGIFAEAAFLSHLLLDDMDEGGLMYLYPLYNEPISLFSYVDVGFASVNHFYYDIACYVAVFFICCVMIMSIFALNKLGFEFEYKS